MRTSALGWRIVAAGALILIFGMSALTDGVGPSWLALLLLLIGTVVVVVGRQQ
ncbi:MAG: hypothetical protein ACRDJW_12225 [Thermomicrobiales bacterium]